MDKDGIDASIGLQFSLELLKNYQENALMQAWVSRLPGISGKCEVAITIVQGTVTSCLAKDQKGQMYTVDIHMLLKLDKDRGPFEWKLLPLAPSEKTSSLSQRHSPPSQELEYPEQNRNSHYTYKSFNSARPYPTAKLNFSLRSSWTSEQKQILFLLYSLVDGKRTIEDIKQAVSLPPQFVEEGLRILASLDVIAIPS
jgi:hypothetical protein